MIWITAKQKQLKSTRCSYKKNRLSYIVRTSPESKLLNRKVQYVIVQQKVDVEDTQPTALLISGISVAAVRIVNNKIIKSLCIPNFMSIKSILKIRWKMNPSMLSFISAFHIQNAYFSTFPCPL